MEKSIINILDSNNIPLIHGPTGIGKTRLAQKIKSFYNIPVWHIICPLEIAIWENTIHSLNNNPKQLIIIDNVDEAENCLISKINTFITKRKKSTKIILIAINPYIRSIYNLRKHSTLYTMPFPSKDALLKKAAKKCNQNTMTVLKNMEINDFRLFKNIVKYSSEPINSDTYLAFKNPFKAFDWLLGAKNNANLENVVESNPMFYINGIHTNYVHKSNNMSSLEKIASHLSDVDILGYSSDSICIAAKTSYAWTKKPTKFSKICLPIWKPVNHSIQRNMEKNQTIAYIFKYYNSKSKKPPIKDMNYIHSIIKSYKISEHQFMDYVKTHSFGSNKTFRIKAFIKKILY